MQVQYFPRRIDFVGPLMVYMVVVKPPRHSITQRIILIHSFLPVLQLWQLSVCHCHCDWGRRY